MEMVESEFEIFRIAKSVSLSFQGLYLIVHSFDFCGSNPMVEVIQYPGQMRYDG